MATKIPVMEIFGPTIQGEGMVIGQKTMFVRTSGCDYSCSWCDSAFTWDGSGKKDIVNMSANEIIARLKELGGNSFSHVTISGGNPALLLGLNELINELHNDNIKVALETQGSKWQEWFYDIDDLTISPKPPSSGMITNFTTLDSIINKLEASNNLDSVSLKVVVFDDADFQFAKEIHSRYPNVSFFLQVGNDDIANTNNEILIRHLLLKYEWLISKTIESDEMNNVRVLPQLHALVWGNKRGI